MTAVAELRPDISLSEVIATARGARFRAWHRPRLRQAARQSMVIILIAAAFDCLWLAPIGATKPWHVILVNLVVVATAVIGYLVSVLRPRTSPEPIAFAGLLAVDLALVGVLLLDPGMWPICAVYALLLPATVALLVPWSSTWYLAWLASHVLLVAGARLLTRVAIRDVPEGDFAGMFAVAVGLGVFGHLSNLRARVVSFRHIQRIAALNREVRRDEVALRTVNRELQAQSRTDALTGLLNRIALTAEVPALRARIGRGAERFAILMLDLDHFKGVNDRLGHFAGDEVLRRVALAIQAAVRPTDLSFRFGGEEFLVVAPLGPGEVDGLRLAERVRARVEQLQIPHPENPPFDVVTVSIGATVVGPPQLTLFVDDWFRAADVALYEAKAAGRNVVVGGVRWQPSPVASPNGVLSVS